MHHVSGPAPAGPTCIRIRRLAARMAYRSLDTEWLRREGSWRAEGVRGMNRRGMRVAAASVVFAAALGACGSSSEHSAPTTTAASESDLCGFTRKFAPKRIPHFVGGNDSDADLSAKAAKLLYSFLPRASSVPATLVSDYRVVGSAIGAARTGGMAALQTPAVTAALVRLQQWSDATCTKP